MPELPDVEVFKRYMGATLFLLSRGSLPASPTGMPIHGVTKWHRPTMPP